jgi:UDP-N-acetyl-D-glucosamine dehydrogenase
MKEALIKKFEHRSGTVGVIGLGYVGLPLAAAFGEAGLEVIGVDVDETKVHSIKDGQSYIDDVPDDKLSELVESGKLRATTDYQELVQADAISICVPTPLRKTGDPDISYIVAAADKLAQIGGTGKLIVLESTTYPGTTEEIIVPKLLGNGDEVGKDVFIAFSPERIDPGRTDYTVFTTPKVIGGVTDDCLAVALALYGTIVDQLVAVSDTATAEMVKLLENTFRAVNIGLVNEVALMCDKLGLDTWEVVDAAATKPYGFMPFYPGPGLGGHCIPIDPLYLSWKLRTLNYTARFIELAAEVNSHMPDYVVSKVTDALNDERKAVKGSNVLILGAAYKRNVNDIRESPALDVLHLLRQKGALVSYHDPFVPTLSSEGIELQSVQLDERSLSDADCVLIITDHDIFDWNFIRDRTNLIVDTRHAIEKGGRARVVYL